MAAYRVKFAPGYSENEALTDLFGSDEEDIPNESDGSEAEEDNMEVEIEDQEEDEEIQDEYVKDDSRFMVSKDEKIKWDTVEPKTPGKILSRNIIRQDAGFPGHIQCVEKSEFFRCFITDLMVKNICQYTNQRANQIKDRKSLRKWKNLDSIEFLAFLGLCITYGVQKGRGKPLNEFWSDEFGFPIFKATMSRSRFENILSCLRFDNKETREVRKRETKNKAEAVSEMMNLFSSACKSSFIPGPNITVDEHLCTFRGRCAFKVYIPSKPGKYGIKIWMAVDCENMYIVNLQIYAGKHGDMREIQQGKRVVMDLVSHLSGSGRNITTDNFFTSFDLGQDLLKLSLTLVGTMRKNRRELPPIMLPSKNREINSSNFAFSHNTLLTSYVPSKGKSVVLLSTQHKAFEICSSEKKKPEVILYYNSTKFGVDNVDQMARQYSVKRGTRRWPLTIFFDIVDLAGYHQGFSRLNKPNLNRVHGKALHQGSNTNRSTRRSTSSPFEGSPGVAGARDVEGATNGTIVPQRRSPVTVDGEVLLCWRDSAEPDQTESLPDTDTASESDPDDHSDRSDHQKDSDTEEEDSTPFRWRVIPPDIQIPDVAEEDEISLADFTASEAEAEMLADEDIPNYLSETLGVDVNMTKSVLRCVKVMKYLGVTIDTIEGSVQLTPQSRKRVHTVIPLIPKLRKSDIPKVAGYLAWVAYILRLPNFLISHIYQRNIDWWLVLQESEIFNRKVTYVRAKEELIVYTDATPTQGGVVIPVWDLSQSFPIPDGYSINAAKVYAALEGLQRTMDLLQAFKLVNVALKMFVDSQVALYSLKKGQGIVFRMHKRLIEMYMNVLIKFEQSHSVTWAWVPSAANLADELSRAVR
ncbi:uncharacterized protein LOC124153174 [Ischnura elegans]|uniref:uncharacterized protein LOC124153174 n=1 Tax=Ischnura elegans TaxID=197161 RepID=UPI001ED8863C|nr:uncharacterized protein LOC124153174 [Ischnura elegans]